MATQAPAVPATPQNLGAALFAFVDAISAAARLRAERTEQPWIIPASQNCWKAAGMMFRENPPELDPKEADPATQAAFAMLENEMLYLASSLYDHVSDLSQNTLGPVQDRFTGYVIDPLDDKFVNGADVVTGSVKALFDKLPKWLQRILEVLMEALKLTKGIIG